MKVPLMSTPARSLLFFLLLAPVSQLSAAVLASYTFTSVTTPGTLGHSASVDSIAESVASDIGTADYWGPTSAVQMNLSATGNPGNSGSYGSTGGSGTPTTAAFAITNNRYWEFTLTPNANYEMDLTSLTFQFQRNAAESATNLFIMSSIDGFASTTDILYTTPGTPAPSTTVWTSASFNMTALSEFQDLTAPLTFRIYAYGSQNNNAGSSLRVDNLTLNGSMVAVPEPSAVGLLLGGLGMLLGFRRLRKTPRLLN